MFSNRRGNEVSIRFGSKVEKLFTQDVLCSRKSSLSKLVSYHKTRKKELISLNISVKARTETKNQMVKTRLPGSKSLELLKKEHNRAKDWDHNHNKFLFAVKILKGVSVVRMVGEANRNNGMSDALLNQTVDIRTSAKLHDLVACEEPTVHEHILFGSKTTPSEVFVTASLNLFLTGMEEINGSSIYMTGEQTSAELDMIDGELRPIAVSVELRKSEQMPPVVFILSMHQKPLISHRQPKLRPVIKPERPTLPIPYGHFLSIDIYIENNSSSHFRCRNSLVTSARVSPGRRLDSQDPRITILFLIAEDIGFPRILAARWKGNDPCQKWYGIDCTDGIITTIYLTNTNLTGFISPRFAELSTLTTIDLSHNRLTGTIPVEILTKLKNLSILDVSYNDLHGKVPEFRKEVVFAQGNLQIETDHAISRQAFVWIGIGIGFLLAGVIGVLYYYLVMRKRTSDLQTEPEPTELQAQPSSIVREIVVSPEDDMIPFHILREATVDFSDGNVIGRGGFSVVYRGRLSDGTDIAVKRMGKKDGLIGIDAFKCEVSVLSKVQHRNLVNLLGYCIEGGERLLVYQLMNQGPLTEGKDSFTTQTSAGTIGYLPPEYTMAGRVSRKFDVFSFGVILMELITGEKAIEKTRCETGETAPHISLRFKSLDQASLAKVTDKTIELTEETRASIYEVAKLATHCCSKKPEQRPEMSYAVTVLASLTEEQWKPIEAEEAKDEFLEELGKTWHEQQRRLEEASSGPSSPAWQD
ncbi:hypothetical protein Bca52824_011902 [Brassica carinata]|uniref:Protein kinase domain-containing protein n=1 Tax=Brassica carinata TaxID=52824 RepID=A0A8X7VVH3_BRACI|nr:hypothetical protein Bca52824_011902 [Brassica carinata]